MERMTREQEAFCDRCFEGLSEGIDREAQVKELDSDLVCTIIGLSVCEYVNYAPSEDRYYMMDCVNSYDIGTSSSTIVDLYRAAIDVLRQEGYFEDEGGWTCDM